MSVTPPNFVVMHKFAKFVINSIDQIINEDIKQYQALEKLVGIPTLYLLPTIWWAIEDSSLSKMIQHVLNPL